MKNDTMLDRLLGGADPAATALVGGNGERLSYGELAAAAKHAAMQLRGEAGAVGGRLVAIAVSDPLGALVAILGAWATGAAVWPVDVRAGDGHRLTLTARAAPVATVVGASPGGELTCLPSDQPPRALPPAAGMLLFTSGSSGTPKGVVLPREGILANVEAILSYLPVRQFPRTGVVLPLSYSYALVGQAFVTLRCGGELHLLSDIGYPIRQVEAMARAGVSGLSSVPPSLRRLAEAASELPLEERPPLGYLASAGAALDAATVTAMQAAFPGARLFNQYGLTEASPRVTALSNDEPAYARGSVGKPLPGIAVRIVGEDGRPLPAGEVGELQITGPSVMIGYLDDPEGTARVLGADGLAAGDFGWMDDEGYVYVVGRRDGIVKCAGERVSVEEVAAVVRAVPGVADAYVVGVPDELLGHRLVAFVEAADEVLPAIRQALRAQLPPVKRPQRIIQLASLPRSANGKVELAALRRQAEDH